MGCLELALTRTGTPKISNNTRLSVIANNVMRPVTVTDKKSTVGSKSNISWTEFNTLSILSRTLDLKRRSPVIHVHLRRSLLPDRLAFQRLFGNVSLVVTEIKKFFTSIPANIDAVTASMKFFAKRTNHSSAVIKHDNGIHDFSRFSPMLNINQSFSINCYAMCVLPADMTGNLHAVMVHFVTITFRPDYAWPGTRFISSSMNSRSTTGHQHGGRCRFKKPAS